MVTSCQGEADVKQPGSKTCCSGPVCNISVNIMGAPSSCLLLRTSLLLQVPLTRSQLKQSPRPSSCSRMALMLLRGATESSNFKIHHKKKKDNAAEEKEKRRGGTSSTSWSSLLGPGLSRSLRSLPAVRKHPNPSGSAPEVRGQRSDPSNQ